MIEYLFKIIICSGIFLLVYTLFLEKEKMYRFNRFYLSGSLVLSLIIPLITFTVGKDTPLYSGNEYVFSSGNIVLESASFLKSEPIQPYLDTEQILLLIYWLITTFFIVMLVINLYKLYAKIRHVKSIPYKGSHIILIEKELTAHSFLNYIFLNRKSFEEGRIEMEILHHELTHVKQRHTIDILLVECISAFLWFNPFIFLFKRAIKLNHEFLADEGVINRFHNLKAYQSLLLDKTNQKSALPMTSQFNFLITKKRLIMITRYTSRRIAILKQSLAIIIMVLATFVFSTKVILAQEVNNIQPDKSLVPKMDNPVMSQDTAIRDTTKRTWISNYAGGTKEGVSPELIKEYHNIVDRYKIPGKKWPIFKKDITKTDKNKLEEIFLQMSLSQQEKEEIAFWKPMRPLSRIVPAEKQFNIFKNAKVYGLWVDEKKVPNSILNRYSAKDFSHMSVSKLYPDAKKGKSYSYQVDLMTNKYFDDFNARTLVDTANTMVIQSPGAR